MYNPANQLKVKKTKVSKQSKVQNLKDAKPKQSTDEKAKIKKRDRKNELADLRIGCLEDGCKYTCTPRAVKKHMLSEHGKVAAILCTLLG